MLPNDYGRINPLCVLDKFLCASMLEQAFQKPKFLFLIHLVLVGDFPHSLVVHLYSASFNTDNGTERSRPFPLAVNAVDVVFIKPHSARQVKCNKTGDANQKNDDFPFARPGFAPDGILNEGATCEKSNEGKEVPKRPQPVGYSCSFGFSHCGRNNT